MVFHFVRICELLFEHLPNSSSLVAKKKWKCLIHRSSSNLSRILWRYVRLFFAHEIRVILVRFRFLRGENSDVVGIASLVNFNYPRPTFGSVGVRSSLPHGSSAPLEFDSGVALSRCPYFSSTDGVKCARQRRNPKVGWGWRGRREIEREGGREERREK